MNVLSPDNSARASTVQRVVPLLQALNQVEEQVASLVLRLDPVVNHPPTQQDSVPPLSTVTGRINALGDVLQYLLENIEL